MKLSNKKHLVIKLFNANRHVHKICCKHNKNFHHFACRVLSKTKNVANKIFVLIILTTAVAVVIVMKTMKKMIKKVINLQLFKIKIVNQIKM